MAQQKISGRPDLKRRIRIEEGTTRPIPDIRLPLGSGKPTCQCDSSHRGHDSDDASGRNPNASITSMMANMPASCHEATSQGCMNSTPMLQESRNGGRRVAARDESAATPTIHAAVVRAASGIRSRPENPYGMLRAASPACQLANQMPDVRFPPIGSTIGTYWIVACPMEFRFGQTPFSIPVPYGPNGAAVTI